MYIHTYSTYVVGTLMNLMRGKSCLRYLLTCVSDPLLHVCLRFSACVKELWRSLVFYSPYLHICAHVYLARVQFGATGNSLMCMYVCTYSDTFKTHRQEATRRELWWVTNRSRSIYMCCTSMHVLWSQDILAGQTLMKTVLNGPGERYN